MSGEKVTEYILLHPKGLAIIDLIRRKGKKYITEMSNELGINRKVVSYHVRKLEKAGLVTTKLERTRSHKVYEELSEDHEGFESLDIVERIRRIEEKAAKRRIDLLTPEVGKTATSFRPVYARYVYLTEAAQFKLTLEPRTILTDEDKTILQTALDRGWFDSPRPETGRLSALAEELGISEAGLSRKLRMISRQLSQGYLETMTRRI